MSASKTLAKTAKTSRPQPQSGKVEPKLLAGGNPQIGKGEGDAPVQAYIAAMPGWKAGRRTSPRCADHARGAWRAQGGQMEFAALWRRGPRLVSWRPLLREDRQGGVLRRCVAEPSPARRVQKRGHPLPGHSRGRRGRRRSVYSLGTSSKPIAWQTHVGSKPQSAPRGGEEGEATTSMKKTHP